jgi:putative transposase
MAEYQVTIDSEILHGLIGGTAGDSGLAKLLEQVLNQVLEAQVSEQIGAARYERTDERHGYRNGLRPRTLTTRVGPLTLRVPQVCDGEFSTELFARYQRSEQALVLALLEMVVNGVSMCKVTAITEELCGTSFSESTVSALCAQLDPVVTTWNERAPAEQAFPFVLVYVLVLKVREDKRIRAVSGPLAIGINSSGCREILGVQLGDSESEASWSNFLGGLKRRSLAGVDLVVSDAHGGLVNAIARHFQGATWQRCQTHLTRDVLEAAPKALRDDLHEHLRSLFEAPDLATARTLLHQIAATYAERAPKALSALEAGFDDATAVLALPEPYRRRLRTTNIVERLNEEIRRRERVIRIFPNRESAIRLLGALLLEQHAHWTTGHRYLDMTGYWQWRQEQHLTLAQRTGATMNIEHRLTDPHEQSTRDTYSQPTLDIPQSGKSSSSQNSS